MELIYILTLISLLLAVVLSEEEPESKCYPPIMTFEIPEKKPEPLPLQVVSGTTKTAERSRRRKLVRSKTFHTRNSKRRVLKKIKTVTRRKKDTKKLLNSK
ncbi:hypothetical protein RB195_020579 [Necator americanus]|uniref:50S ribosomal protein L35 domain protein n=1 Tax=Necator americanus TaxID=51031 RepID=A0ABR1CMA2_NECAM